MILDDIEMAKLASRLYTMFSPVNVDERTLLRDRVICAAFTKNIRLYLGFLTYAITPYETLYITSICANHFCHTGEFRDALAVCDRSVVKLTLDGHKTHIFTGIICHMAFMVSKRLPRKETTKYWADQALRIFELHPETSPELATPVRDYLAVEDSRLRFFYNWNNDHEFFIRAPAILENLGDREADHYWKLASMIAVMHYRAGRHEEGDAHANLVIAPAVEKHGDPSLQVLGRYVYIENCAGEKGLYDISIRYIKEKILPISEAISGEWSGVYTMSVLRLAELCQRTKNHKECIPTCLRILEKVEEKAIRRKAAGLLKIAYLSIGDLRNAEKVQV